MINIYLYFFWSRKVIPIAKKKSPDCYSLNHSAIRYIYSALNTTTHNLEVYESQQQFQFSCKSKHFSKYKYPTIQHRELVLFKRWRPSSTKKRESTDKSQTELPYNKCNLFSTLSRLKYCKNHSCLWQMNISAKCQIIVKLSGFDLEIWTVKIWRTLSIGQHSKRPLYTTN